MADSSFLLRHPAACAALSGVFLIACFPRLHFYGLAWVALAPLLAVLVQRRARGRMFFFGWLAGAVFFAGTCAWIYDVLRLHGRLSVPVAAGVLLLFALVLGIFFGLFSLAVGELARRWQLAALLLAPFPWVALEWLRTYAPFGGFPWNLLGSAVAPEVGWIQPAAHTGVYGVSFLIVGVNALAAYCWLAPSRRRLLLLGAVVILLAGAAYWGRRLPPAPTSETALLVQTNLPQTAYDPDWVAHHPNEMVELELMTRMSATADPAAHPALIIWPEIPVSLYFHEDPVLRGRLLQLAQATRSYLLVGVVEFRTGADGRRHPTNSVVLLSPDGGLVGQYDKIHLVPFGEYVPLGRWLGFLEPLTAEVSDFVPGREPAVLPAGPARLGPLICYEAIFPGLARRFVVRGADVLVNVSNDGWYGESAALAQHLNLARVRAVENRRFLLRATNTGLTAVVDPYGRIVAQATAHTRTVLGAGYAPRRELSSYARHGDWFAALCALVAVAALARKFWVTAVEGNE